MGPLSIFMHSFNKHVFYLPGTVLNAKDVEISDTGGSHIVLSPVAVAGPHSPVFHASHCACYLVDGMTSERSPLERETNKEISSIKCRWWQVPVGTHRRDDSLWGRVRGSPVPSARGMIWLRPAVSSTPSQRQAQAAPPTDAARQCQRRRRARAKGLSR